MVVFLCEVVSFIFLDLTVVDSMQLCMQLGVQCATTYVGRSTVLSTQSLFVVLQVRGTVPGTCNIDIHVDMCY